VKIPDDEEILSQSIPPKHTSKQAPRSAYQFKPRGNAPNRYIPKDYVNRGKKVVIEKDEAKTLAPSLLDTLVIFFSSILKMYLRE
jgi:hypothetical protein